MSSKPSRRPFNRIVRIGHRSVGEGHPCFIVAEAGSNHNQKLAWAHKLIDVATAARADAVKFQTFVPDKIYVRRAGFADYLGRAKTIQEVFKNIMMPPGWIPALARHCRRRRILFLSSAFDEESVDLVDPFVLAHKIASYECTHLPLIRHVAAKGKPVLLSTAMATLREIEEALETISSTGNRNVILMHCVARYPAPLDATNLRALDTLRRKFGVPIGLSDHSREPQINPVACVARGGNIIEKHFTLKNTLPGPDHKFALEPHELREMITAIRGVEAALGSPSKGVHPIERELFSFARRRIHAIADIRKGERFSRENIAVLRSGKARPGLEPKHFDRVLARRARTNLRESDGVRAEDVT